MIAHMELRWGNAYSAFSEYLKSCTTSGRRPLPSRLRFRTNRNSIWNLTGSRNSILLARNGAESYFEVTKGNKIFAKTAFNCTFAFSAQIATRASIYQDLRPISPLERVATLTGFESVGHDTEVFKPWACTQKCPEL
jgi:hypothetical protein